jgi:RNA polymerase sigma factor (sigma-70 family)
LTTTISPFTIKKTDARAGLKALLQKAFLRFLGKPVPMPLVPPSRIIRHLRAAVLRQTGEGPEDAQLLDQFLSRRDEAAFEALVRRHGPMVFGVCRRVLGGHHDAEDAFQATFLILACKAAAVRNRGALGSWLYGVAYRTSSKARARAARRRVQEREAAVTEARNDIPVHDDLVRLLDGEISRLPEKYQGPVLLCDLEGVSRKEAARRLGLAEGTLSSRLASARSKLAQRLAGRGLALAGGGMAVFLAENTASAAVPASLISSTVQAATRVAAGCAVTAAASASVASLAKGVMNAMLLSKLKTPLVLVLALGFVTLGWGAYQSTRAADDLPTSKELVKAPAPEPPAKEDADDDIDLPVGTPLTQVRVRLDKNGKLVVKMANGQAAAPDVTTLYIQRFDLADVNVMNVNGKKIEGEDLTKLLKKETIAMASLGGEAVDPLHLRVLKEGTLVLALPAANRPAMMKGMPGLMGGGGAKGMGPAGVPGGWRGQ